MSAVFTVPVVFLCADPRWHPIGTRESSEGEVDTPDREATGSYPSSNEFLICRALLLPEVDSLT